MGWTEEEEEGIAGDRSSLGLEGPSPARSRPLAFNGGSRGARVREEPALRCAEDNNDDDDDDGDALRHASAG